MGASPQSFIVLLLCIVAWIVLVFCFFWRMPFFSHLRRRAIEWDSETLESTDAVTVKEFRKRNDYGGKIVVCHHLYSRADRVRSSLSLGLLIPLLFIILVGLVAFVGISGADPSSHTLSTLPGGTPQPQQMTVQKESIDFFQLVMSRFGLILSVILTLFYALTELFVLIKEVYEYKDILLAKKS